jgi:hypothetical protein
MDTLRSAKNAMLDIGDAGAIAEDAGANGEDADKNSSLLVPMQRRSEADKNTAHTPRGGNGAVELELVGDCIRIAHTTGWSDI